MKRILVGVLLLVAGLLGLFMTLCGGVFTVTSFGSGGGGYAQGILIIAAPSLIVGGVLLRVVWKQFFRWRAANDSGVGTGADGSRPSA